METQKHLGLQAHRFPSPLVNVYTYSEVENHDVFIGKSTQWAIFIHGFYSYLTLPVGFPETFPTNPSTRVTLVAPGGSPVGPRWVGRPRCGHRHHHAAAAESGGCGEGHPKLGALRFSPRKWRGSDHRMP